MVEKAKKNENNRFHRKKEQWLKVESVSKIPKNFNIWGFPPPWFFLKIGKREARLPQKLWSRLERLASSQDRHII